jgi:hypothetical protein
MTKTILLLITLLLLAILSQGQNNLNHLFFLNRLDTCTSEIITQFDKNQTFDKEIGKIPNRPSYKLKRNSLDKLKSDSLLVQMQDIIMASSEPNYKITSIEVLRYYSDIRTINKAYNEILNQLLDTKFLNRIPQTARADSDGIIRPEPNIIISTGFEFQFDNEPFHSVKLFIDYLRDFPNQSRLKNTFILRLEYNNTRKECE